MTTYTNIFGGSVIRPADVSYLAVTLTANIGLEWPMESNSPAYPVASTIDVTCNTASLTITLPDATSASPGQTILFNGLGGNSQSFSILDNSGGAVATVAPGKQWIFILADTTTAAGTWRVFQLGANTATALASALAGYGLTVLSNQLSQATQVTTFNSSPRAALSTDRASLMVWTNVGAGTFTLPAAATVGNNWFVMARNAGGGDLTIDPNGGETINGAATIALHPGDSALIATDGTAWYTVGLGRDATFAFDFTSISLAAAGATYTLSGAELNRVAYKFTGALSNNVAVVVPPTVQQYWVDNSTTGAFTVSLKTSGGTPVSITQGSRGIYYCNGANVVTADTASIAVPISASQGGTGQTTYTIGDLIYASGASTLSKLGDVAIGNALISGGVGVAPSYGKIDLGAHITGTLGTGSGGTGVTGTPANGQLLIGNGAGFTLATVTAGSGISVTNGVGAVTIAATASMVYPGAGIPNSTGSAWGTSYSTSGSGTTLALTNSPTFVTPALGTPASGTLTNCTGLPIVAGTTGTLTETRGGTNQTSVTTGDLLYGSAANTWGRLADVATGNALISGGVGVGPSYGKIGLGTHVSGTLGIGSGGTGVTSTPTNGQLLIGNGSGYTLASLTAGANVTITPGAGTLTIAASGGSGMVYPSAGIAVSTGSAWDTSLSSTAPTFTTNVTTPIIYGGNTVSSRLALKSTSGAGTSDGIDFYTGNNVLAGSIGTKGNWSITGSASTGVSLQMDKAITGNVIGYGIWQNPTIQSDVTNGAQINGTFVSTAAASFTLSNLYHYLAQFNSKGASSSITNQYGFYANIGTTAGTNNFSFYASGTAPSRFEGDVQVVGALGYFTGAGGTVTQATNRTTGVTLNKVTGAIMLVSAAGSTSWQTFTVTNSTVAGTDVIRVVQKSGADKYMIHVTNVSAGSFDITFATTGGTTTEQPVFNFAVIKGANS